MAVIDLHLQPSKSELRWFGVILLAFFGLVGGLVLWQIGSRDVAVTLWSIGAALALLFYCVPPLRIPMYRGWMYAVFPIGWVVSHLVLGLMYYLVLTPVGLVMRLVRYDPMQRRLEPDSDSYWTAYDPANDPARYFRQF